VDGVDEKVYQLWDPKKTFLENYHALGILPKHKINSINSCKDKDNVVVGEAIIRSDGSIALEDFEMLNNDLNIEKGARIANTNSVIDELFHPRPARKLEPRMSKQESIYWKRLISKHGNDYKAMERDMKLNYYQHTEIQCQKRCTLYCKLFKAEDFGLNN